VLEVSIGTGWLLTRYAGDYETHGVDLNERMVALARRNLERAGVSAELRYANVEALPYPNGHFDTVVNTMAFTGYPNGRRAMSELHRVLRPQGRIVMIDVGYPGDGNKLGCALVGMWKRAGDVIRDLPALFEASPVNLRRNSRAAALISSAAGVSVGVGLAGRRRRPVRLASDRLLAGVTVEAWLKTCCGAICCLSSSPHRCRWCNGWSRVAGLIPACTLTWRSSRMELTACSDT
jgi:SAM-dependent methyltransferase